MRFSLPQPGEAVALVVFSACHRFQHTKSLYSERFVAIPAAAWRGGGAGAGLRRRRHGGGPCRGVSARPGHGRIAALHRRRQGEWPAHGLHGTGCCWVACGLRMFARQGSVWTEHSHDCVAYKLRTPRLLPCMQHRPPAAAHSLRHLPPRALQEQACTAAPLNCLTLATVPSATIHWSASEGVAGPGLPVAPTADIGGHPIVIFVGNLHLQEPGVQ